ncbi:MAG: UDP-N-acetylmuramoyl-L-alanyl-D-glutamate--2,6-diaminopimelate ligase [Candidatus Aminicenantes bacterium]|nr:MAG: UDP-N-acetylmuramoyl-L-alanyl-D-glutamate--2,6-diaminopimelate ligase [Candidatus Aminicenantes bacterium]
MKIKDLLQGIPTVGFHGKREEKVMGIAYSSRSVNSGYLFAALRGEKKDGFHFIPEAIANGATTILSERPMPSEFDINWIQVQEARRSLALCSANFFHHPSRRLKVVGITGTKGKTTITYLIETILKTAGFFPGVIGTVSYRGPGVSLTAERTTPEAPDLQRLMQNMVEQKATHCVMEVSSHSLELDRVTGIDFDVAVFTNLSGEHLDYHQTMERYFEAKKKLFFLSTQKKTMAVVNTDNAWGKKLIEELHMGAITFGLETSALVRAEEFSLSEKGIDLVVRHPAGKMQISSPLLGRPNLYNILAAVATSLILKLPETKIAAGIASLQGIPGRFEKIQNSFGMHIFVDYAHNDDSLRQLLESTKELAQKKIIVVFGAGGDRDKSKRSRMGEAAGRLADYAIITSDNPRSEEPLAIIAEIERGMKKSGSKQYEVIPDRKKAIARALTIGQTDDYILVAGKGHEDYQIIKDRIIHFSDTEVILELLKKKEKNSNWLSST